MLTQFFHGGFPGLQRGSFVLPPDITKARHCGEYIVENNPHRTDRVYVSTAFNGAAIFAALHPSGKGVVYEVEPLGVIEDDPDCEPQGISYQCAKARVIRIHKLSPKMHDLIVAAVMADTGGSVWSS